MAHDARLSTWRHKAATTVHKHGHDVCFSAELQNDLCLRLRRCGGVLSCYTYIEICRWVSPGDNISQFKEHAAQSMAHDARILAHAIGAATTEHKHRHVIWHSVISDDAVALELFSIHRNAYKYSLVIIQHDKNTCHSEHAAQRTTHYASYQGCVNRASTKVCVNRASQLAHTQHIAHVKEHAARSMTHDACRMTQDCSIRA